MFHLDLNFQRYVLGLTCWLACHHVQLGTLGRLVPGLKCPLPARTIPTRLQWLRPSPPLLANRGHSKWHALHTTAQGWWSLGNTYLSCWFNNFLWHNMHFINFCIWNTLVYTFMKRKTDHLKKKLELWTVSGSSTLHIPLNCQQVWWVVIEMSKWGSIS